MGRLQNELDVRNRAYNDFVTHNEANEDLQTRYNKTLHDDDNDDHTRHIRSLHYTKNYFYALILCRTYAIACVLIYIYIYTFTNTERGRKQKKGTTTINHNSI